MSERRIDCLGAGRSDLPTKTKKGKCNNFGANTEGCLGLVLHSGGGIVYR